MTSWRDRAACKGTNTNIFYPELDENSPSMAEFKRQVSEALSYCKICPVKAECRKAADEMERRDSGTWGIWGGELPKKRKERRRREQKVA